MYTLRCSGRTTLPAGRTGVDTHLPFFVFDILVQLMPGPCSFSSPAFWLCETVLPGSTISAANPPRLGVCSHLLSVYSSFLTSSGARLDLAKRDLSRGVLRSPCSLNEPGVLPFCSAQVASAGCLRSQTNAKSAGYCPSCGDQHSYPSLPPAVDHQALRLQQPAPVVLPPCAHQIHPLSLVSPLPARPVSSGSAISRRHREV